jgi:hypothetical protein
VEHPPGFRRLTDLLQPAGRINGPARHNGRFASAQMAGKEKTPAEPGRGPRCLFGVGSLDVALPESSALPREIAYSSSIL